MNNSDKLFFARKDHGKYTIGWITTNEQYIGNGLRHPLNIKLSLLRREQVNPLYYQSLISVDVPKTIAIGYGRFKRLIARFMERDDE